MSNGKLTPQEVLDFFIKRKNSKSALRGYIDADDLNKVSELLNIPAEAFDCPSPLEDGTPVFPELLKMIVALKIQVDELTESIDKLNGNCR